MSIHGLDTSSLSFQVKRKPVDELSSSTKKTLIATYQTVKKQRKIKFAEAAAPGQVDEFIEKVLGNSSDKDENSEDIPNNLEEFL